MLKTTFHRNAPAFLFALAVCLLSVSSARADAEVLWANGFTPDNAGFDRIAVFTDFTVINEGDKGDQYVAVADSIAAGRSLDALLVETLEDAGYKIGVHDRYFVGALADTPMPLSKRLSAPLPKQDPPFHEDPSVSRVTAHLSDVDGMFRAYGRLVVQSPAALQSASLPAELTSRTAGNYRSSGLLIITGVMRPIESEIKGGGWLPPTTENLPALKAPYVSAAYFEAVTGKLVYFVKAPIEGKQKIGDFEKELKRAHKDFPEARVARRFAVPPMPEFDSIAKVAAAKCTPFSAPTGAAQPGFAVRMGVLQARGGIPFRQSPDDRFSTRMLPPGTQVKVIGYEGAYSKVVLQDCSVGWSPSSQILIRR
ncbi:MAG: hypothetical protein H6685_10450 [Deltaproteobacteria bacterium]|nr:hypothetical protein [Deltaproteobacteria bacterium]